MTKIVFQTIKYFAFFALFVILQFANIGVLNNFAFGFYFCLVWCGQSILLLSPLYVLSAFLHGFDLTQTGCACVVVGVLLVFYFLHYKFKKPLNMFLLGVYSFLSQVVFLYLNSNASSQFFDAVLSVFCGIVFMYCSVCFLQNLLTKGIKRKFYVEELICAGVLITVFASGLYWLPYGQYICFVVASFLILLSLWVFGSSKTIILSTLLGLGLSLSTQNISFIVRFVLLGIAACAMFSNKRIFAVMGLVLVDVVIELYLLPVHLVSVVVSTSIGAILFLIVPKKTLKSLQDMVVTEGQNNALFGMLQRNKKQIEYKLHTLQNVFLQMRDTFISMVKSNKQNLDAIEATVDKIENTICQRCPNKNDCLVLNNQETFYHLNDMCKVAYKRGSVNIVDAAPTFAKKCVRLPVVVNCINHNMVDLKELVFNQQNNNQSRLMLAEQLYGVSQVFETLSNDFCVNTKFDREKEDEIIENLAKVQVLCTECLVYQSGNSLNVSLTVRSRDLLPQRIERVVSNVLNSKLEVHSTVHSSQKHYENVMLKTKNNYEIIYGCSGTVKFGSESSGDTYAVQKLENNKVLFSICDGMGSGTNARNISKLSLSLIENYYKAGFESSVVLKLVNNLLSQRGEDQFSAVDLGIIDLNIGMLDLYKVGAPCSFLKHKTETEILKTGALPLGIVKEVKPYMQNVMLNNGDYLILVSDGVCDEIGDNKQLSHLINNVADSNPQNVANEILSQVLAHAQNMPKDDMTVLVCKIIKN